MITVLDYTNKISGKHCIEAIDVQILYCNNSLLDKNIV